MTRTPMGASVVKDMGFPFPQSMMDRYNSCLPPQGIGAEMIAEEYGLTRDDLDAFGAESQQRAARATAEGRFDNEIVPVPVTLDGTTEMLTADEGIREGTTIETLANLKPAFKEDGIVTAGNSSQISDGASAVLVMSEEKAAELGLKPRARFHASPSPAPTRSRCSRARSRPRRRSSRSRGSRIDDIDLFEVNEAFASVVLAWAQETAAPTHALSVPTSTVARSPSVTRSAVPAPS